MNKKSPLKKIEERLNTFNIKIWDYFHLDPVVKNGWVSEGSTVLEGITFVPKNLDGSVGTRDIRKIVSEAQTPEGKVAFADKNTSRLIAMSMAATKGTGYREIWYAPAVPSGGPAYLPFASNFPTKGIAERIRSLDVSSLHVGISGPDVESDGPMIASRQNPERYEPATYENPKTKKREQRKSWKSECTIHVDEVGIVANLLGNTELTVNAIQHTVNELLWKTNCKNLAHASVANLVFDNFSLSYPSSENGFQFDGPSVGQAISGVRSFGRALRVPEKLMSIGRTPKILKSPLKLLKQVPLPSLSFKYQLMDDYKVFENGTLDLNIVGHLRSTGAYGGLNAILTF